MNRKINGILLALGLGVLTPMIAGAQETQPLFTDNFSKDNGNWKFINFENRLAINWKTVEGKTAVVLTCAGNKDVDTAFDLSTKPLPLSGQQTYEFSFEAAANFPPDNFGAPHRVWSNRVVFYDADGKMLEKQHFGYFTMKTGFRKKTVTGKIPANAKSMSLIFGGDAPNITPGKFLAITNVVIRVK